MGIPLHLCTECPLCRKDVPRHLYQDHYNGHFQKRKHVSPHVAGEVTAQLADPSVPADLRTVDLP